MWTCDRCFLAKRLFCTEIDHLTSKNMLQRYLNKCSYSQVGSKKNSSKFYCHKYVCLTNKINAKLYQCLRKSDKNQLNEGNKTVKYLLGFLSF